MINQRINILLDSQVITQQEYDLIQAVDQYLRKYIEEGVNYEMFLTHLAMMLTRYRNNEIIQEIDGSILEEIKTSVQYGVADYLANEAFSILCMPCNSVEKDYLTLHLCNCVIVHE